MKFEGCFEIQRKLQVRDSGIRELSNLNQKSLTWPSLDLQTKVRSELEVFILVTFTLNTKYESYFCGTKYNFTVLSQLNIIFKYNIFSTVPWQIYADFALAALINYNNFTIFSFYAEKFYFPSFRPVFLRKEFPKSYLRDSEICSRDWCNFSSKSRKVCWGPLFY